MYKKFTESFFRWDAYAFSRLLLKMKLIFLLLTATFLQVRAESYAQKVTVIVKDASLSEVIAKLRKQTSYDFLYNNATLEHAKPITIHAKGMPIMRFLDSCFRDQPFEYQVRNNTILIMQKTPRAPELVTASQRQQLTGVVRDTITGEVLIGVSVGVEGSSTGTSTDENGAFSLNLPGPSAALVVSYIGYETKRVVISGQTQITILLKKANTKLDEVVVVGYGTRTKGAVTGAISTVNSEVFENRPLNNSFDALQGTLPGVTITRASGQPGNQGYTLQTRGYSSINGNVPLVMIDGIPGDLNVINPNDIANITVLKDAAASIYGARAADGVILVTTKKGRKGPPEVLYTLNLGLKKPTYLRKITNTLQFAEMLDEGLRTVGQAGFDPSVFEKIKANAPVEPNGGWNYGVTNYPGFYGYTDWNKEIYKNSSQQIHNISVSGGGENNSYLLSLGYNRDNGNLRFGENNMDRYNMRLNYDFRLLEGLTVETRTSFENQVTREPSNLGNALTNVPRQFPYAPVHNPEGQFYGYQGYENPAQTLAETGKRNINYSRFTTNLKIDYAVMEGLKLTGQASVKMDYYNDHANYRTFTRWNYAGDVQDVRQNPNSAYYQNTKTLNKLYQVYFDYTKRFAGTHGINLTGGASLEQNNASGQTTWGYNFLSNDIFTLNLADRTQTAYANFTGSLTNSALASYFGRLSYDYKEKIILDITARADGSSKFAPDKRWSAVFPSVALAYNLTQERFLEPLHIFDMLKLRVSWGKMGNQEIGSLGLYDYIPLVSIGGNYPIGSPNAGLTGANSNPASADRTWETIENRNIGLDVAVLQSRLSFTFDYFTKINDDMLVGIAVPATYGGSPPSSNQGRLVTRGFETALTWKDQINDFRYSVMLQLSDSKNKLVELKNSDNYSEGLNFVREGYSIYSYFGYEYAGIIRTQKELDDYKQLENVPARIAIGDVMYKDLDGDGRLTAFGDQTRGLSGDMKYLGNLLPRYTFSSNINLGWKNFDLSIFLQGVGKRNIQYSGAISTPNTFFWPSLAYYHNKTWSPERPDAQYPRYIPGNMGYDDVRNYNYRTSALVMQNVAYLRFKVITLGYDLPRTLAARLRMKSARIYFSGQDLFTISKGTLGNNFDPEDGFRNEGTYPFNKIFAAGLNVKF
ncbi:TonB-dependent receptor [Chitinophaga sp. XS-30]|nr:TonB-dependent receptor [Chitinophaga sp. XS-30]